MRPGGREARAGLAGLCGRGTTRFFACWRACRYSGAVSRGRGSGLRHLDPRHGLRARQGRVFGPRCRGVARRRIRNPMTTDNPQGGKMTLEGKKVVLAYSGGLDTSVCLKWLEQQGATPYALYLDLGQGEPAVDVKTKALKIGAADALVRDAKAEFAQQYVAPAIKANALYGGKYALFAALGG